MTTRRDALRLALIGAALPLVTVMSGRARAAEALPPVVIWKNPNCGCCESWVRHMQGAGFRVAVHNTSDMAAIKHARGVPDALRSCHTATIGGNVVEGHVPAADIKRLIAEHPQARGLAVAGMPPSAPGMDQPDCLLRLPADRRVLPSHQAHGARFQHIALFADSRLPADAPVHASRAWRLRWTWGARGRRFGVPA